MTVLRELNSSTTPKTNNSLAKCLECYIFITFKEPDITEGP